MSVTGLEILSGVLKNPAAGGHASFFFRDEAALDAVPADKIDTFRATGKLARDLNDLKREIGNSRYPVTSYASAYPAS